ncbi:hypothetical protein D3C78_571840 [compost metagenome]
MTVGVAFGGDDGHAAFLVDTEEAVRAGDRLQGIDCHGQAAIGAVLEADGRRQARSHFAVGLRFGSTRTDGRPADQVLQVLRRDRVEGFGRGRQAHFRQVQQQLAADVQAVLNLERVVQVRIVDQAFPADRGARLLEVHTHDQVQGVGHFGSEGFEALGVFVSGFDVVDRAGTDHHEQAVILAVEDVAHHFTARSHGLERSGAQGNFLLELIGGDQGLVGGNV